MSELFNPNDHFKITQNGKIAECISYSGSIYGLFTIPNQTNKTFKWQFKCLKCTYHMAIGIDAAQNNNYNDYFYNDEYDTINYAYEPGGYIYDCGEYVQDKYTSGWKEGSSVTLIYVGSSRTLSLMIDGEHQKNSILKVKENKKGFKMAVDMYDKGDSIELLSFSSESGEEEEKKSVENEVKKMVIFLCIFSFP